MEAPPQSLVYNSDLQQATYNSTRYKELEGHPAWQDFYAGMLQIRDKLRDQVLTPGGTVDQWGQPHDEEKKAIIEFLNTLLLHNSRVHERVEKLRALREKANEVRKRMNPESGQIHGDDSIFQVDL